MICQQCQKRLASVQIVQNVNGKQLEIFLCEICASNNEKVVFKVPFGFGGGLQVNLNDLLPGLINLGPSANQTKELTCNLCGMTFQEFQKTGRIGCGNCYELFHNELTPIIARIHGNVEYRGKLPGERTEFGTELTGVYQLKKELKEAISKEEYEKAAQIRDKIKEIEARQIITEEKGE